MGDESFSENAIRHVSPGIDRVLGDLNQQDVLRNRNPVVRDHGVGRAPIGHCEKRIGSRRLPRDAAIRV